LADILLRLYIKHSRLQEALKLALGILERARTQPAHRHNSRWIPAHVLDILLETLKQNKMDKESASLVTAFGEYQAELQIVSK
jgi:hypothetical protein